MRIGLIALLALAGCSAEQATAPQDVNVCWRVLDITDGEPQVAAVVRDVPNLESCAVRIEGLRLIEGRPVTGLYNAQYIFATETELSAAPRLDGARVRVFLEERRLEIQEELKAQLTAREAGAEVRRGPRTVVAPPPIVEN